MASRRSLAVLASRLPKVELHVHLDGSYALEQLLTYRDEALVRGAKNAKELGTRIRGRDRSSMKASLGVFDTLVAALQTHDDLVRAAKSALDALWDDGTVWAELRFCPALHGRRGLTPAEAVAAVAEGVRASMLPHSAIIVCALRQRGPEHALEMARTAAEAGAHGFDVAGDEQRHPLRESAGEAMRFAAGAGLGVTAHAGEWPGTGANVSDAIELGARRIGHGCAIGEDPALAATVARAGVTVECCPTANVGSGRVASFATHPALGLLRSGVRVCMSVDNLCASGSPATGPPTPSGELLRLMMPRADAAAEGGAGGTVDDAILAIDNAARGAFGTPEMQAAAAREALLRRGLEPPEGTHADGTTLPAAVASLCEWALR